MENALFPGDKIIVSKLNYGPKLPENPFEIPWVNIFFYFNKTAMAKGTLKWWDYRRLSGFTKISHNDIVVFKHPEDENTFYIKRCIGSPGDTIRIINSNVFINGKPIEEQPSFKRRFKVWFNDANQLKKTLTAHKDYFLYHPRKEHKNTVELFLSEKEKEMLIASGTADSMRITLIPPRKKPTAYPQNILFPWSVDQYGPIRIPAKGVNIELTSKNFILYQKLINNFEKQLLEEIDGVFYLNGNEALDYTFKQDYFFMMGDNRHDSMDSRFIGFIPEELIEGKATFVLLLTDRRH